MKLSVSTRIAEGFLSKEEATLTLEQLSILAAESGYDAICMRASQVGIHSGSSKVAEARTVLDAHDLQVSMVSGDFDIVYNNERGPNCLHNIGPYLDLAEQLGAPMIRVCMKTAENIPAAKKAVEAAAERGLVLVHQCHVQSLFETIDSIEETLRAVDHDHFGLIYEAANLEQCGQDYGVETIARLAPWIRNVYLQNQQMHDGGSVVLDTWCRGPVSFDVIPIAEPGGVDFPSVFAGLKAVDYQGPITVHQSAPEDPNATLQQAAVDTVEYLRVIR